jgi:hypothetical protein
MRCDASSFFYSIMHGALLIVGLSARHMIIVVGYAKTYVGGHTKHERQH